MSSEEHAHERVVELPSVVSLETLDVTTKLDVNKCMKRDEGGQNIRFVASRVHQDCIEGAVDVVGEAELLELELKEGVPLLKVGLVHVEHHRDMGLDGNFGDGGSQRRIRDGGGKWVPGARPRGRHENERVRVQQKRGLDCGVS